MWLYLAGGGVNCPNLAPIICCFHKCSSFFIPEKKSSMPFTLSELVPMMTQLRDVCLGIIELAHPDAKPTVNEDYRIALKRTGVKTRTNNTKESTRQTMQWGHLFKVGKMCR